MVVWEPREQSFGQSKRQKDNEETGVSHVCLPACSTVMAIEVPYLLPGTRSMKLVATSPGWKQTTVKPSEADSSLWSLLKRWFPAALDAPYA